MPKTSSKDTANLLGYYFIIFQSNFKGYVKCWMDGSEDYTFLSEKEFIELFNKIEADPKLIYKALDCLNTTSIYIWNILEGSIKKLSNKSEIPSLTAEIFKMSPLNNERKKNGDIIERRII